MVEAAAGRETAARTEERRVRARDEGLAHEGLQEGVVRSDHLVEVGGAVEGSLQRVPRALEHLER